MSNRTALVTLLMLLGLGACALSPQVVTVDPEVTAPSATAGNGTAVALDVVDARGNPVIGHRGGVYSKTATISTTDDMTATVRRRLSAALENAGYRVVGAGSAPVLHVEIAGLDYSVNKQEVSREVTTVARINAVFRKGNKTYNNTYTVTRHKKMLFAPGEDENAKLINATLAAALQRLLDDNELLGLINATG